MINHLNLASRPFRNRTLPWAITIAVMSVSLVALILIARAARQTTLQADAVEAQLVGEREKARVLQARAAQVMSALAPEEMQSLTAAHRMVDQKRFSWSRLLADLEQALPANVRVEQVSINDVLRSGGQTYADLEMTVVSREASDVTRMINEMARAGIFDAEPLSQDVLEGKSGTGVRFALRVHYRPRAETIAPAAPPAADATTQMGDPVNEGSPAAGAVASFVAPRRASSLRGGALR